jgi:hypothetical protein
MLEIKEKIIKFAYIKLQKGVHLKLKESADTKKNRVPTLHIRLRAQVNKKSSAGVADPRPKKKCLRPKLESRISDFPIFWVYFFRFLLSCGPKSRYF